MAAPSFDFARLLPLAVLGVGSLLVVTTLVAPVTAGPPPAPVCGICGDSLEGATEPGTLDIYVDHAGDSRWIARVPVDDEMAATYRTDPDRLDTAVEEGWYTFGIAVEDASDVETSILDGTVEARYTVEDVATPGVGESWLLEYFYAGDTPTRYELRAERVTIYTPDGYTVTNEPANANASGSSVTWTSDDPGQTGDFSSRTYVTYANSSIVGTLESRTTVAIGYGPLVVRHAIVGAVGPVSLVGATTIFVWWRSRRSTEAGRRLGAVVATIGRTVSSRFTVGLPRDFDRRALLKFVLATAAGVTVVGWLWVGPIVVFASTGVVTAGLFLPFGHALESGERAWPYGLAASLTPIVAVATLAPFPYDGLYAAILVSILSFPWIATTACMGYLLSILGRHVAPDSGRD